MSDRAKPRATAETEADRLQNLEVERAVLAVVLDGRSGNPWATLVACGVSPRSFSARDHVLIAWLCERLAAEGHRIDVTAVAEAAMQVRFEDAMRWLTSRERGPLPAIPGLDYEASLLPAIGGPNALTDIAVGFAPQDGLVRNAELLVAYQRLREAVEGIDRARAALLRPGGRDAVPQVLGDVSTQIAGLAAAAGGARENVGDHLAGALATIRATAKAETTGRAGASWGLRGLDAMVPLRPGRVYVLAAPPSAGKTSLALQAATATAKACGRGAVAFASLEMPGADLATILAGRRLGFGSRAISERDPRLGPQDWERLDMLAEEWRQEASLLIHDTAATGDRFTAAHLLTWLRGRAHAPGGPPALAIIDYVQLLDGEGKDTEYQTITKASRQIKRAATQLGIPILALAQMSREGRKPLRDKRTGEVIGYPEPTSEDLRGSGALEQDADAVIFIHQPDAEDLSVQPMQILVRKNRQGPRGRIDTHFHRPFQIFKAAASTPPGAGPARLAMAETPAEPPRPSAVQFASEPTDAEDLF